MHSAILLIVAALTLSSGASAQNQFERQVLQLLGKLGETLRGKGYELTYQVHTGSLKEAADETVTFRLRRGVRYALLAVCDQDCGDLDVRLFDPSDREVARDVQKDDTPIVEIVPDKTGEYSLKVEMAECSDQPCAYGVGVYAAGEDEFDKQVRDQLERGGRDLASKGFRLTHQIYTGDLKDEQSENVVFELDPGSTYVVVGVCDNDCKDLDLKLVNAAGKEIDTDVEEDDAPVVAVTPAKAERYTVRAIMADCGASPCRYGLGVFAK